MGKTLEVIKNWLIDTITGIVADIFNSIMTIFSETYIALATDTDKLMGLDIVQKVIAYGKGVAIYLLVLKLIVELIKTYQLQFNGDISAENPLKFIKDATIALFVILNVDFIINEIYRFGTNLMVDVVAINNMTYETLGTGVSDQMTNGVDPLSLFTVGTMNPFGLIFIGLMMVLLGLLFLIICFQMAIRKAELIYYQFLAPFLSINIASPNKDLWGMLIKSVVSLSVAQSIQILMIFLVFESLQSFSAILGLVYAFAFTWVALKTPQTLKQFVHGTGVGGAIGSGGRMMVSARMMRGFKK